MVVGQILLLGAEAHLRDEASHTQLLDDRHDVELGVEACTRLTLQLVLGTVAEAAAQAPRTAEVLFATEAPA